MSRGADSQLGSSLQHSPRPGRTERLACVQNWRSTSDPADGRGCECRRWDGHGHFWNQQGPAAQQGSPKSVTTAGMHG